MAEIRVNSGEPIEKAIRRFKKQCDREGILLELKKRRFHLKPAFLRHEAKKKAERRRMRKMRRMQTLY